MRVATQLVLGVLLVGCARIDFDYPRAEAGFIADTGDTYLARRLSEAVIDQASGTSGFVALPDGIDALAARLRLASVAERTIDVQYYLIKRDLVGQQFLYSLLKAADRNVRVRLLLDDMFNKGFDADMRALEAHPNIEIRVYNPFHRGLLGRNLGALFDFGRINRRMHNKSFTVDNQVTIIGGRNIADEYFGARTDAAFGDLDMIGIGPIVTDVSQMFDTYWAHETAIPVAGFIKPLDDPEGALTELRSRYAAHEEHLLTTRYASAVISRAYEIVETDASAFSWAPYKLVYDTPDKGVKGRAESDQLITAALTDSLAAAESEAFIVSPYFVPRKRLIEAMQNASQKGLEISVLTNSLAANNQKTVHGGYMPSRKPLLEAGVKIYEVRADANVSGAEYVEGDAPRSTLHTKAYVVDRRELFIGSFNFDPRSADINTEMGVLIADQQLALRFYDGLAANLPSAAWEVRLTDSNDLRWFGRDDGEPIVVDKEPQTNWWQRFMAGVYRALPIRSQL